MRHKSISLSIYILSVVKKADNDDDDDGPGDRLPGQLKMQMSSRAGLLDGQTSRSPKQQQQQQQ